MQSSTETATKHSNNSTADSKTHHFQDVGEDRLSSSVHEDGDFVSYEELMKNAPVFPEDEASTRSMDSHQWKAPHLRVIIDERSYVDFDGSRNILISQDGRGGEESTTRSMDSYISTSEKFHNNGNILNLEKGDEDVNADAVTLWQQTQEESRKNSDDEASESSHDDWSIYWLVLALVSSALCTALVCDVSSLLSSVL